MDHLRQVLTLLSNGQWVIKLKKGRFAQQEIFYLGHVLSVVGVSTDPAKIDAIVTWPVPNNVKELLNFVRFGRFL